MLPARAPLSQRRCPLPPLISIMISLMLLLHLLMSPV
jgi:hypothetical protein